MGPVETTATKATKNQQQRKKTQMHNPVTELAKYKRFIYYFFSPVFAVGLGVLAHTFTDLFIINNFSRKALFNAMNW